MVVLKIDNLTYGARLVEVVAPIQSFSDILGKIVGIIEVGDQVSTFSDLRS